jgi:hypothetical protein
MPTWLIIIIIVAAIGGFLGFVFSNDGERGEGAAKGAAVGAMGCGYALFQLFIWGIGIYILIWLFDCIFG